MTDDAGVVVWVQYITLSCISWWNARPQIQAQSFARYCTISMRPIGAGSGYHDGTALGDFAINQCSRATYFSWCQSCGHQSAITILRLGIKVMAHGANIIRIRNNLSKVTWITLGWRKVGTTMSTRLIITSSLGLVGKGCQLLLSWSWWFKTGTYQIFRN